MIKRPVLDLGDGRLLVGFKPDAYAAAVLVARMEDAALDLAPVWDDLTTFDGRAWRGRVDLIAAGFPCQPASTAGARKGIDDARWLWPYIADVIADVEPAIVFLENVPGLLTVNAGRGFHDVVGDLADLGFDCAWDLFSAAEVGAPHLRQRLFLLALAPGARLLQQWQRSEQHLEGEPSQASRSDRRSKTVADAERARRRPEARRDGSDITGVGEQGDARGRESRGDALGRSEVSSSSVADASSGGWRARDGVDRATGGQQPDAPGRGAELPDAEIVQRQALIGDEPDGVGQCFPPRPDDADGWRAFLERAPHLEPAVRRGADGLRSRVDRLRCLGNAVLPLVAAYAFRTLAARMTR